ncbi:hypothetical protein GYMLUDRAFT_98177 [Collybiopsis luxurians FD-317 M1]|uniref:Uncharacterized protein n=1 Tax=Collybiopsis luxurians FD-317 M1 TaxID=944289 RepID=A0A0D0CIT2_9AGAR|nr:hypothetical protein GYMLUDRAFT_98177 [Collybiopsis luxurians FD-317 M1]
MNSNAFSPPNHPNFVQLGLQSHPALMLTRHWGAPLEFADSAKTILNVYSSLVPEWMGGKICMFDSYESTNEFVDRLRNSSGSLTVGSPGIGKSTFLLYKLVRRLSDCQETLYYAGQDLFLFNKQGAFHVQNGPDDIFTDDRWRGVMALVDAEAGVNPPPKILWTVSAQVTMVFATSPQRDRYKEWLKQRFVDKIIPKAPDIDEAFAVWKLFYAPDAYGTVKSLQKTLLEAWQDYGPDLRLGISILKFGSGQLKEHRDKVAGNVNELTSDMVTQLISKGKSSCTIMHSIVETMPKVFSGGKQAMYSCVCSQAVMRLLIAQYAKKT